MRIPWLSALSVVPLSCLSTPLTSHWNDMHVKHAWEAVPTNWESVGHPHPNATIDLFVALKPDSENALINVLYEVSTPAHPKYGAYLSKEEVAELVAPHPDTLELVHYWLAHHDVQPSSISTTHGSNWLTLSNVPVSQANELLGASYQLYRYVGTNDTAILRTVSYSLPKVLHAHVQTVVPTTFFASPRTLQQIPQSHPFGSTEASAKVGQREVGTMLSSRDEPEAITPEFLGWLYKTFAYVPAAITKNAVGIVGFGKQYVSPTDLTFFMGIFRREAEDATFTLERVNGGEFDPSDPGVEANLDMQYSQVISYPTPHVFYSTGGKLLWFNDDGEPAPGDLLVSWIDFVLNLPNIPQTISTSYGIPEKDIPLEYAKTVCDLFLQLGARGVSVLFSSGDNGVGKGSCEDSSGKVQFIPRFPASCPYVTSVGGTTSSLPEIAANLSGGGFSNHFLRSPYQDTEVPVFLRRFGRKYRGMYNAAGRGIPDISAQALRYIIAFHTNPLVVSGTSCAVPTVAGIISLLNDFLISEKKPPLGFLNPWLYGDGLWGINDITYGYNPGCNTDGFSAIAGWDPVTGLGTPDFFELLHVLLRTRILGPGNQARAFSKLLLNNSDAAVPTRDDKEIDEYFNISSSTATTTPVYEQNEKYPLHSPKSFRDEQHEPFREGT